MKILIKISLFTILQFISFDISATGYGYFVSFTDKNGTPYSVDAPEEFLSARAIERRERQNIPVTATDLPVNPVYVDSLKKLGIKVKYTSKWMNGCIAFSSDKALMDTLDKYGFVSYVELTYKPENTTSAKLEKTSAGLKSLKSATYGSAYNQISTVNGIHLHEKGKMGQDKIIAIIDAGFYGVDYLPAFQHLWENGQILGTKDFVDPTSDIFLEHQHGMNVLSIIGGKIDGSFMGTAPEAMFWLLRTEDVSSEYPIEADYWVCAAEFADSAGVDVINSSLGYCTFDDASMNYTYSQLDGKTLRISRAASIAAATGMMVVVSAGNEGNSNWQYITAPADAENIIAVGAMNADSIKASFSSYGPSADGRIKPEVTAMGVSNAIQLKDGTIGKSNGTSFSAPVIAGLSACLLQSLTTLTTPEVRHLILQSCNDYDRPTAGTGYGIPNFKTAYYTSVKSQPGMEETTWSVYPNPFRNQLVLANKEYNTENKIEISLYDITGKLRYKQILSSDTKIYLDIPSDLSNGMYILHIRENKKVSQFKLMKEGY